MHPDTRAMPAETGHDAAYEVAAERRRQRQAAMLDGADMARLDDMTPRGAWAVGWVLTAAAFVLGLLAGWLL